MELEGFGRRVILAASGALAFAIAVSAFAQGLPLDWSHRHVIYANPDTEEEAAAKGKLDEWDRKANDPRFVLQLERKEAKAAAKAMGDAHAAVRTNSAIGKLTAASKKKTPVQPGPQIHRDWSNVMGGAGGSSASRVYPAKFAFGVTEKDCVDDFVVFTTSAEGTDSAGTFLTQTGTFSGLPVAGQTVTIANKLYAPDQVLTLTAHASDNIGLNFAVGANASEAATNLANAIARNGGSVGVTATASGATVTIASITTDVAGNEFDNNETLSNFTLAGKSAGNGTKGQPTIFALNHLYASSVANDGCQTPTQAVPATYWSYNTTSGTTYAGATSPQDFGPSGTIRYGPLSGACTALALNTKSAPTDPLAPCDTIATRGLVRGFRVITSRPPVNTTAKFTVMKNGAPTSITCSLIIFISCADTIHQEIFADGDVISVRIIRTGAGTGIWNTGMIFALDPLPAIAQTSPVLSFHDDGAQVAFVQRVGTEASLVLLKWSSSSPGTLGAPTTPTSVTPAEYRACSAPCMTVMALSGDPDSTNSSPYVDYAGDALYVGDDTGKLHQFTGVFQGTPAEAGSPYPVQVAATTSIMSSPVFDGTSTVYIGSNGPDATSGNKLHWVDTSSGTVTSSGKIGSASTVNGVRDAPILDTTSGKIYAFQGAFTTASVDAVGDFCPGNTCNTVFQFPVNFDSGTVSPYVFVGQSGGNNDLARSMNSGAFDDEYYSSGGQTGRLYVCGSQPANPRRATLWKISFADGSFSARTQGPLLVNGDAQDGCSPPTVFNNGGTERLYVSVNTRAAAPGGAGCTAPADGCVYMYTLAPPVHATVFDTTSKSSSTNDANRYLSVSESLPLDSNEGDVDTALTGANAGAYNGMTITQSVATPPGTTNTYTLNVDVVSLPITCSIPAGATTCSDTLHKVGLITGNKIDVVVRKSAGGTNLTATFRVQLTADVTFNNATSTSAALNATGGTGGIIIDNTVTGGGSQIYYSTRTSPGVAVQASQAGLK